MDQRFDIWAGAFARIWTAAAVSFVVVAIAYTATIPRNSAAVAQPIATVTSVEDAAAGITFKIVTVDAMSQHVSWVPPAGDGSN